MIGRTEADKRFQDYLKVYELAKAKNEAALKELGISLDAHFGTTKLLTQFAEEGNHEVVYFLINTFNLSIDYAAEGYARAGNTSRVNSLIEQGADIYFIARGYAYGKQTDLINKLLKSFEDLVNQEVACFLVEGYAQGGHVKEVSEILDAQAELLNIRLLEGRIRKDIYELALAPIENYSLNFAIQGYAISGNKAELQTLLLREEPWGSLEAAHFCPSTREKRYRVAAEVSAQAGNLELVEFLIQMYNEKIPAEYHNISYLRELIYKGYVAGGYIEDVTKMVFRPGVSSRLAFYGHKKQVLSLTDPKEMTNALYGALDSGAIDIVNELMNKIPNKKKFLKDFCRPGFIDFLEYTAYFSPTISVKINRLISQIDNEILRKAIINSLENGVYSRRSVLKMTGGVNKIMHGVVQLRHYANKYKFTPTEAQIVIKPYIKVWLLQGVQLFKNGKITPQMFRYITEFVTGIPPQALEPFMTKFYSEVPNQFKKKLIKRNLVGMVKDKHQQITISDLTDFFKPKDNKNSYKPNKNKPKERIYLEDRKALLEDREALREALLVGKERLLENRNELDEEENRESIKTRCNIF